MLTATIAIILILLLLLMINFTRKTLIFNKLLYLNIMTNITVILIVAIGSYKGNSSFLDIALIYTLLGFIAIQAFVRYYKHTEGNLTDNHND